MRSPPSRATIHFAEALSHGTGQLPAGTEVMVPKDVTTPPPVLVPNKLVSALNVPPRFSKR
jgi:hypothetical protein